jgi:hypothetical protein
MNHFRQIFKQILEGNEELSPAIKNQIQIAKKTLKMSNKGAGIMGGMTKEEARSILKKYNIKFNE